MRYDAVIGLILFAIYINKIIDRIRDGKILFLLQRRYVDYCCDEELKDAERTNFITFKTAATLQKISSLEIYDVTRYCRCYMLKNTTIHYVLIKIEKYRVKMRARKRKIVLFQNNAASHL